MSDMWVSVPTVIHRMTFTWTTQCERGSVFDSPILSSPPDWPQGLEEADECRRAAAEVSITARDVIRSVSFKDGSQKQREKLPKAYFSFWMIITLRRDRHKRDYWFMTGGWRQTSSAVGVLIAAKSSAALSRERLPWTYDSSLKCFDNYQYFHPACIQQL